VLTAALTHLIATKTKGGSSSSKSTSKKASSGRPQLQMLPREELRMVLCVNQALKMGKGKIGM
jgi:hypothetical protein